MALNRELIYIRVMPRQQPYCFAIEKIWGEWQIAVWKQGRQEPGSYRKIRLWGRRMTPDITPREGDDGHT